MKPSLTLLPIWLALPCLAGNAHADTLTVKSLNFKGTMPYVQSGNARLAERINNLIYLQMVDLPAPVRLQDGLKEPKTDEVVAGTSDIDFKVSRNDNRLLALTIDAEGCGAYCEHYSMYFSFDATTGRHLDAEDLFTREGSVTLIKQLDAQRLARVKTEITRLRSKAKTAGKGAASADADGAFDAIEMYEQCATERSDAEAIRSRTLASDGMKIGKDSITFVRGRCSNHAAQALDNIGDFENTLTIKGLAPHLSAYGKYLLLGAERAPASSSLFNQVLTGKIGQAPITLYLGTPGNGSLSGIYYYNKYRKPIPLYGKATTNTIELEERENEDKPPPVLRATVIGESLKGWWIGGSKQIAFEATP